MKKNKSQLAKLLATENIEVQENAVKTASFDVKDRVLTIPIFKEEQKSKHVYDMLVGHEVSHALHTPADGWMKMSDRSDEFRSFVNVIEDARIDKLIQKKYPGLTNDYLLGFKKMYKDNFFGTKGRQQSEYALIDKINMYFKSSKTLNFNFNNKENHFVKVNVNVDPSIAFACFEEEWWECAFMTNSNDPTVNTYTQALVDMNKDLNVVNEYDPAGVLANKLVVKPDAYVSVDLSNLKTGNKYIDAWFDVRLYNKERQEHPYEKMYVRLNDFFYIGFHARNTRRLPYNVNCVIGQEYVSGLKPEQVRYKNV